MRVDGVSNCHNFWDKQLLYVLFNCSTSVQIYSGSNFLAYGRGLLPVNLLGYHTLPSLAPAYWVTIYLTKTLYIRSIKIYSDLLGAYHEYFSFYTFRDSQGRTFTVKTTRKTASTTSISTSSRRINKNLMVHTAFCLQVSRS